MARPVKIFTKHETNLIARYALNGGKNNTIAAAIGIPVNTLTNRFNKLLKKCRAKRKLNLARYQTKQAKTSADMAKFLGKNELGQTDRQEIKQETVFSTDQTPEQRRAAIAAANTYKAKMA